MNKQGISQPIAQNIFFKVIKLILPKMFFMGVVMLMGCGVSVMPQDEFNTSPIQAIQQNISPVVTPQGEGAEVNLGKTTPLATPTKSIPTEIPKEILFPNGTYTPTPLGTPFFPHTPTLTPSRTPKPDRCPLVGGWESYTDSVAGYTLQYPAEARLSESASMSETYRSISIFLNPTCYNVKCWGLSRVVIVVLYNPQQLPIKTFVAEKYDLYNNPPAKKSLENYNENSRFTTIAGVEALWIDGGIFDGGQPDIFIPHGEYVISIGIGYAGRHMPTDYGTTCDKVLEQLDQILDSMILLP